jgi:hypothetical protein
MIQFKYKLKLNEWVRVKCSRHFHYNQRNATLADGLRAHYLPKLFVIGRHAQQIHPRGGFFAESGWIDSCESNSPFAAF